MSNFIETIADAVGKIKPIEKNVTRAAGSLPQTAQGVLFNVSGAVKILEIVGEVTTVIETQANNTKLVANPTTGSDTDLCGVLDITAKAVGSMFNITGTFANALVNSANGAHIAQAGKVVLSVGTLDLNCAASNTGAIKWSVRYIPLEEGAKILAA